MWFFLELSILQLVLTSMDHDCAVVHSEAHRLRSAGRSLSQTYLIRCPRVIFHVYLPDGDDDAPGGYAGLSFDDAPGARWTGGPEVSSRTPNYYDRETTWKILQILRGCQDESRAPPLQAAGEHRVTTGRNACEELLDDDLRAKAEVFGLNPASRPNHTATFMIIAAQLYEGFTEFGKTEYDAIGNDFDVKSHEAFQDPVRDLSRGLLSRLKIDPDARNVLTAMLAQGCEMGNHGLLEEKAVKHDTGSSAAGLVVAFIYDMCGGFCGATGGKHEELQATIDRCDEAIEGALDVTRGEGVGRGSPVLRPLTTGQDVVEQMSSDGAIEWRTCKAAVRPPQVDHPKGPAGPPARTSKSPPAPGRYKTIPKLYRPGGGGFRPSQRRWIEERHRKVVTLGSTCAPDAGLPGKGFRKACCVKFGLADWIAWWNLAPGQVYYYFFPSGPTSSRIRAA